MIDLHVPDAVTGPNVRIRWCVRREDADDVAERPPSERWLLVVVRATAHEEEPDVERRYLFRLDDGVAWVPMLREGTNVVGARVLRMPRARARGYLHGAVSDFDTDLWHRVEVVVPLSVFARPAFDRRWVNFMTRTPCADECEYRRRRLFAYTLQPLMLVAAVPMVVAIVVAMVVGRYTVTALDVGARLLAGAGSNIAWRSTLLWSDPLVLSVTLRTDRPSRWCSWWCSPLALCAAGALGYGAWAMLPDTALMAVLMLMLFIASVVLRDAGDRHRDLDGVRHPALPLALVCSDDDTLPPEPRRTLRMRFAEIKARVCRPYEAQR